MSKLMGARGAQWGSGALLVATLGTLLVGWTQLPMPFHNATRGSFTALTYVAVLFSMPLLAAALARVAHRKTPRRAWWIAFGVLALCWAGVALFTLVGVALSQAIATDGFVR